jgi:hypothetical protein
LDLTEAGYFHFFFDLYNLSCSSFEMHNSDLFSHFYRSFNFAVDFDFGSSGNNLPVMNSLDFIHTLNFVGNGSTVLVLPHGVGFFNGC